MWRSLLGNLKHGCPGSVTAAVCKTKHTPTSLLIRTILERNLWQQVQYIFEWIPCKFGKSYTGEVGRLLGVPLPINPTPRPFFRVSWTNTLFYPGSCGRRQKLWRAYPDEGCCDTSWLTGLQAKVESIVLKAAWHWGRDCSVLNCPLGEPDHTPTVCRPSVHVGLHGRWLNIFRVFRGRATYWGDRYKWMN